MRKRQPRVPAADTARQYEADRVEGPHREKLADIVRRLHEAEKARDGARTEEDRRRLEWSVDSLSEQLFATEARDVEDVLAYLGYIRARIGGSDASGFTPMALDRAISDLHGIRG